MTQEGTLSLQSIPSLVSVSFRRASGLAVSESGVVIPLSADGD